MKLDKVLRTKAIFSHARFVARAASDQKLPSPLQVLQGLRKQFTEEDVVSLAEGTGLVLSDNQAEPDLEVGQQIATSNAAQADSAGLTAGPGPGTATASVIPPVAELSTANNDPEDEDENSVDLSDHALQMARTAVEEIHEGILDSGSSGAASRRSLRTQGHANRLPGYFRQLLHGAPRTSATSS